MSVPAQDYVVVRSSDGSIQTYNFEKLENPAEKPTLTLLYSKFCLEQKRWIIICVDRTNKTYHRLIFEDDTYKRTSHCNCENCKLITFRNALGIAKAHNRNYQLNLLDSEGLPLTILNCQQQGGLPDKVTVVNMKGEVHDYIWRQESYQKGTPHVVQVPHDFNLDVFYPRNLSPNNGPPKLTPKYIEYCNHVKGHIFYATTPGFSQIHQFVFNTVELGFEKIRCETCELKKRWGDVEQWPDKRNWAIDASRDGRDYEIKLDSDGFLTWNRVDKKASVAAAKPIPQNAPVDDILVKQLLAAVQQESDEQKKAREHFLKRYPLTAYQRPIPLHQDYVRMHYQRVMEKMMAVGQTAKPPTKPQPEPTHLNPHFPYYYGHPSSVPSLLDPNELLRWAAVTQQMMAKQEKIDENVQQVMDQMKAQQDELARLRLLEHEARGIGSNLFAGLLGGAAQAPPIAPTAQATTYAAPQAIKLRTSSIMEQQQAAAAELAAAERAGLPGYRFTDLNFPGDEPGDIAILTPPQPQQPPRIPGSLAFTFSQMSQKDQEQYLSYLPFIDQAKATDQIRQYLSRDRRAPQPEAPEGSPSSESSLEHVNWRDVDEQMDSSDEHSETGYESPV